MNDKELLKALWLGGHLDACHNQRLCSTFYLLTRLDKSLEIVLDAQVMALRKAGLIQGPGSRGTFQITDEGICAIGNRPLKEYTQVCVAGPDVRKGRHK